MLWDSIPDEILLQAVEDGSFATEAGFKAQVSRMLEDERFDLALGAFHAHWLKFAPNDKPEFLSGMRELELLVAHQFRSNAQFSDFMTTTKNL